MQPIMRASELLESRGQTHGSFDQNAKISQRLKEVIRTSDKWMLLSDVEREAIDMICVKFSRILSGKSLEKQHWEDVEGYAHLVLKGCK